MHNPDKEEVNEIIETLTLRKERIKGSVPPLGGFHGYFNWYPLGISDWRGWARPGFYKTGDDIGYFNLENNFHRIHGPAYISEKYDIRIWYKNGKIHRYDGPAIIHKGTQLWFLNGLPHRLDGPAVIDLGGPKQYWINGVKYSMKEYRKEIQRRHRRGLIK